MIESDSNTNYRTTNITTVKFYSSHESLAEIPEVNPLRLLYRRWRSMKLHQKIF